VFFVRPFLTPVIYASFDEADLISLQGILKFVLILGEKAKQSKINAQTKDRHCLYNNDDLLFFDVSYPTLSTHLHHFHT
jgi:hypothetical protein